MPVLGCEVEIGGSTRKGGSLCVDNWSATSHKKTTIGNAVEDARPVYARRSLFSKVLSMKLDCKEEEKTPPVDKLLFHPVGGKRIDPQDVDGLIDALESVKKSLEMVFDHKRALEGALCKHAKDLTTKTRRVQGEHRIALITMPNDRQDSATLKVIAESKEHKLIWPQLIRVATYSIKMKEFKKAKNTKGTEDWNGYRDAVARAILEPTANPTVKIEK